MEKLKVGLLGATGEVGQRFVLCLQEHPWFELVELYASARSAGKKYREAVGIGAAQTRWYQHELPAEGIQEITVRELREAEKSGVNFFFSALPSEVALEIEGRIAKGKPVVSTASAYRYFDDSFTYLPSVNEHHAPIIEIQRKNRGWKGFVVPQPNCTTIGLAISLKPIYDSYGLERVIMASMQAVSGAGYEAVQKWAEQRRREGSSLPKPTQDYQSSTFEGNVIPYIKGEEEKVKRETVRLLGRYENGRIIPADFKITCKCNRVPVLEGHTESVFIQTREEATLEDLKRTWERFEGEPQRMRLPTAPLKPILFLPERDRPQPRFDSMRERGMVVCIGGLERHEVFPNGFQYTVLSHNTELGAARGAVLAAEYLFKAGYLP